MSILRIVVVLSVFFGYLKLGIIPILHQKAEREDERSSNLLSLKKKE
jgi:hypothetical protein